MYDSTFLQMPHLEKYRDKICVIYACTSTGNPIYIPVEEYVTYIRSQYSKGKTKFIFMCSPESLIPQILIKIQIVINTLTEIPAKNFFFHTSGLDAEVRYNRFCIEKGYERRMNILISHNFEWVMSQSFNGIYNDLKSDIQYNVKIKDKKFTCFNKVHRIHRIELLCKMIESNLISQSYYSFEGGHKDWIDEICTHQYPVYIKNMVSENKHMFPLRLIGGITENRHNPVYYEPSDFVYHDNSYFSVVTETVFYKENESPYNFLNLCLDGVFITEKTYRPIILKHPFIILAYPKTLEKLRECGFKTFHPYIDESYDVIECGIMRMKAIFAEIQRLCSFTDNQWIEWQTNVKPILDHNYNIMKNRNEYAIKDYGYLFND